MKKAKPRTNEYGRILEKRKVPVKDIAIWKENYNEMTSERFEELKKSMLAFPDAFNRAGIDVTNQFRKDKKFEIADGNHRYKIAIEELRTEEVNCNIWKFKNRRAMIKYSLYRNRIRGEDNLNKLKTIYTKYLKEEDIDELSSLLEISAMTLENFLLGTASTLEIEVASLLKPLDNIDSLTLMGNGTLIKRLSKNLKGVRAKNDFSEDDLIIWLIKKIEK